MIASMTFGVAKEFDEILQNAGVEILIVDNDKKAHSKTFTGEIWNQSVARCG